MLLFFMSLVLVFAVSFLITAVLEKKSFVSAIIYILLFSFANVVLTLELLSLFSAISIWGVLLLQGLWLIIAAGTWITHKKPVFEFTLNGFCKKLYASFYRDKYLAVLAICVLFMLGVSLWLISFMPVVNPDAEAYHVLRSVLWVLDKKISHLAVADVRNLVLPINSELLYAWVILFVKKQIWFGIFSFCGYVLSMVSLWGVLSQIGVGFKRKLWTIFIVSSFASVIVQVSSTETDIIIAGLILSSMYLFIKGLNTNKNLPIVISALSYALAVGVKTPAIMMIPSVGLWMLGFSIYKCKKGFYKPFLMFCGAFIINFLIFSSYNYILNFIAFGNIAGSKSFMAVHQNSGGLKAACANFIKYIFMFFDFTGFALNKSLGALIIQLRDSFLISLGLQSFSDGFYSSSSSNTNISLLEPLMGLGILGFLVYLPCLLLAFIRPIFTKKKQDIFIMSFAFVLLIALWVMACQIEFMTFSIRFFTAFCVISSPVIVYSYSKKNNIFKFIAVCFAIFYLTAISTHLWARPALNIYKYFRHGSSISQVREIAVCSIFLNDISKKPFFIENPPVVNEMCVVRNNIRQYNKNNKILYFSNTANAILPIALMNFEGYCVDFNIIENVNNIDFSKYNLILVSNDRQISTNVLHFGDVGADFKYYNSGISCRYMDTNETQIKSFGLKYPYLSSCLFEDYFYKNNNFVSNKLFTVQTKADGETFTIDYKFYENKNNPIVP